MDSVRSFSESGYSSKVREESIIQWLKENFQESCNMRTECCIVRGLIRCVWPSVSDRLIGSCIRKAFPSSIRLRSNSTYYYANITRRQLSRSTGQLQINTSCASQNEEVDTNKTVKTTTIEVPANQATCIATCLRVNLPTTVVPEHLHLRREAISLCSPEHILSKGESSTVLLAKYEGISVAVKQFKQGSSLEVVLKEVHLFLKLGPHESLPMLVGIVIGKEPFLIVWKFYGMRNTSVNLSFFLQCLGEKKKLPPVKWVRVIIQIAQGVSYLHEKGYLHGKIEGSNIIIYKANDGRIIPKLVGLGNFIEFNVNDKDAKEHISQEIFYLGSVLGEIYERLSNTHPSTGYMLARALNDKYPEKCPSANEIAEKFQYILDGGHFDS